MKVLLIGSGGRECALSYKIRKSPILTELKVYPGNAGFPDNEIYPRGSIDLKNKSNFQNFIKKEKIDLVIVGPEEPLVNGISDWVFEAGILCFGPSKYCARLEGSKDFAKEIMGEFGIPTAKYASFDKFEDAEKYILNSKAPIVVKADGLAAGKGVTVAQSTTEAILALKDIFLYNKFSFQSPRVVIEEFMNGEEASIFAISDGNQYLLLPAAQDHKRAFDGDKGPNTGGMGAYAPAPIVNNNVLQKVRDTIFSPIFEGLKQKGYPYRGLLYAGLMIENENPRVVEFNCRFGDPETQALMLLLEDDLLAIMVESAEGEFKREKLNFYSGYSSVVVLAAEGYPGEYTKKIPLNFKTPEDESTIVFHAGTERENNIIFSNGGRILGIASRGKNLRESIKNCYNYLEMNPIENTFYRRDIAGRAL